MKYSVTSRFKNVFTGIIRKARDDEESLNIKELPIENGDKAKAVCI